MISRVLIVATLAACSNPTVVAVDHAEPPVAEENSIEVELPARYVHWQPHLEFELRSMQQAYVTFAARWQREVASNATQRRVVVPVDGVAAAAFYQQAGLEGNPATPRTFPALALAVVPLPRDDSLLAEMPTPPRTWLHSLRHEVAHLLSEDYPELRHAPAWFQEGIAELWCEGTPQQAELGVEEWPFWRTIAMYWGATDFTSAPSEVRYSAYAMRALSAMFHDSSTEPWLSTIAMEWVLPNNTSMEGVFLGLRGRDADWDLEGKSFMLASHPRQQVDLDLPWYLESNSTTGLVLQQGRAPSASEAGLILSSAGSDPANSPHVRIRHGQFGGWAAYPELGSSPVFESLSTPSEPPRPGLPHQLEISIRGNNLEIRAQGFRRRFQLDEINLQLPLQLRMYVRDGVLALHYQ